MLFWTLVVYYNEERGVVVIDSIYYFCYKIADL